MNLKPFGDIIKIRNIKNNKYSKLGATMKSLKKRKEAHYLFDEPFIILYAFPLKCNAYIDLSGSATFLFCENIDIPIII